MGLFGNSLRSVSIILKIQFFRLAWIGAGAVHDDKIIFTDSIHTFVDLLHRGHAR